MKKIMSIDKAGIDSVRHWMGENDVVLSKRAYHALIALGDTPEAQVADDTAMMMASAVLDHIDTMYPDMWKMVAKTARTSIRNTIRMQSVHYLKFIMNNSRESVAPLVPSSDWIR